MNRTVIGGSVIAILALTGFLVLRVRSQPADDTGTLQARVHLPIEPPAQGPSEILPSDWARADEETIRLSPDKFPNLPSAILARLRGLGCTIPQTYLTSEPHSVIKGRFISNVNADWAVLCSRERVSAILVFAHGSPDSMIELEARPDIELLQTIGGGRIGFSRQIGVADPRYILSHYEAHGGPGLPPLDHDGINDIFVEKASVVLYWHEGEWLQLQGAD